MKLKGKDIWILTVATWAGTCPDAKHWYWYLENTETAEEHSDESRSEDLDRSKALRRGFAQFLQLTNDGQDAVLMVGSRLAIIHGVDINEYWIDP